MRLVAVGKINGNTPCCLEFLRRFRLTRQMSRWAIPTAFLLLTGSAPLHAETLKEALTAAYLYNPILKAAQAQLRATDNGVSQAKSGYRPTITASYQEGWEQLHTRMAGLSIPGGAAGNIPLCTSSPAASATGCNIAIPLSALYRRPGIKRPVQSQDGASPAAGDAVRRLPHLQQHQRRRGAGGSHPRGSPRRRD